MIKKIVLVSTFVLLLFPIYFMIVGSFQTMNGVMKMPPNLIPLHPTFSSYAPLLNLTPETMNGGIAVYWKIEKLLMNTGTVVLFSVISSVFVSCGAGFVFAFYGFAFKKVLWSILLVGLMIPRISLILPTYMIMKKIGLSGTLAAAILPIVFSPFGMFLAKLYFESIPKSLLESARLDGAHEGEILVRIVMPVCRPLVVALSVFSSIMALQDYLWQSLVLQMSDRQTLLVGLMKAVMTRGGGELSINSMGKGMAAGVLLLIPLLAVFVAANKYFVENISGAMKE